MISESFTKLRLKNADGLEMRDNLNQGPEHCWEHPHSSARLHSSVLLPVMESVTDRTPKF